MAIHSGVEARVKISNVFFSVKQWRIQSQAPDLDVTNTEGKTGNSVGALGLGFSASRPGPSKATYMLKTASFDDAENPFAAPLSLREGLYVLIQIFPGGAAGNSHQLGLCLITSLVQEGDVQGLSPVTIEGTSDGNYILASS